MHPLPKHLIGRFALALVLIASASGCLLPAYSYLPRIIPPKQHTSIEEIESSIVALELHGKGLQQVAAVLAQRGFQNGGRRDDELIFRAHPSSESINLGKCDHVIFRKEEYEGFLMTRIVCITCILGENDRVVDLMFSECFVGP